MGGREMDVSRRQGWGRTGGGAWIQGKRRCWAAGCDHKRKLPARTINRLDSFMESRRGERWIACSCFSMRGVVHTLHSDRYAKFLGELVAMRKRAGSDPAATGGQAQPTPGVCGQERGGRTASGHFGAIGLVRKRAAKTRPNWSGGYKRFCRRFVLVAYEQGIRPRLVCSVFH